MGLEDDSSPSALPMPPSPTSPVPLDEAVDMMNIPTVPTMVPYTAGGVFESASADVPSSPTELPVPNSPTSYVPADEAAELPEEMMAPVLLPVVLPYAPRLVGRQQPGTPTYSPTEDIYAPATPLGRFAALPAAGTPLSAAGTPLTAAAGTPLSGAGTPIGGMLTPLGGPFARFGRSGLSSVGRSSVGRDTQISSPTYIMEEMAEEPLPPTPTYTGSSPTYLDEAEPPTPTLDADDDELYGRDDEERRATGLDFAVARASSFAAARATGTGTPGTPPSGPGTPLGTVAGGTPTNYIRMPGMESPTPTYEPDDEEFYGGGPAPPPGPPPPIPAVGSRTPQSGALPGTPAQGGAASSSGAAGSGELPLLASQVFGARKREQPDAAASQEELPPWKRRVMKRKPQ